MSEENEQSSEIGVDELKASVKKLEDNNKSLVEEKKELKGNYDTLKGDFEKSQTEFKAAMSMLDIDLENGSVGDQLKARKDKQEEERKSGLTEVQTLQEENKAIRGEFDTLRGEIKTEKDNVLSLQAEKDVQSALTDVGVDKSFFSTLEKAIRVDLKKTDSGFVGEFDGKELPVKEYVQEFMKDKSQFITRETPGGGGPPDKSTPNGKRFMKKSDAAFLEKMNAKTKK